MSVLINSQLIATDMDRARFDPAGQLQSILTRVEAALDGDQILVDPGNPYMFLMEAAVTASAYALNETSVYARKQYPSLATAEEDIYLWMTDRDYADRFAQPSWIPVTFLFSVEEIKTYAVDTDIGGVRKLTIPKDTELTVGGTSFTLEYPIDIKVMSYGGISIVYGEVENTPLHTLTDNTIGWLPTSIDNRDMIMFTIPVYQFKINSQVSHLNAATVFNESYSYEDKFYYCRCYMSQTDGSWKEIRTTHTDQVFDPTVPTALLKVYAGKVWVKIPQIYYTNGLMSGDLRIDIYTTKAVDNMVMSSYMSSDWTARWVDLDNTDGGKFTAPMIALNTSEVLSNGVSSGSRQPLTAAELRARVMDHNVGQIVIPITNVHVDRRLTDAGFEQVTDIDDITNRVIWGTKPLPVPTDGATITPASAGIEQTTIVMEELRGHYGVSDNGERMTLHPSLLFKDTTGTPVIVDQMELDNLYSLRSDGMARSVSGAGYLYTPFYYALDTTEGQFSAKPYMLDAPVIETRQFIDENPTTAIELAAGKLSLTKTDDGYVLHIVTSSGDSYKNIPDDKHYVQLAYTPPGEDSMAYLNGTLLGRNADDELVWEFKLDTNYDIDRGDNLYLTSFSMFSDEARPHPVALSSQFDIIYIVADYTNKGMTESDIDLVKNGHLLPDDNIGVLQERARLTLGYALEGLWSGSRTIPTQNMYEVYEQDTPMQYQQDVYKTGEDGITPIFTLVDGRYEVVVLHKKGDIVYDDDGNVKMEGYKGELKHDVGGNLILISGRLLAHQIDMFFVDGVYYFATNSSSSSYKQYLASTVKDWVLGDIANLNTVMFEKSKLYYYPRSTIGNVTGIVGEGEQVVLNAMQSFKVTLYLTEVGYANSSLKQTLNDMVIRVIASALGNVTVAVKDIVDSINSQAGDEVLGIDFSGIGGTKNYSVLTAADNSGRLAIAKKLLALSDGTFGVEEDVDVAFVRHLPLRDSTS